MDNVSTNHGHSANLSIEVTVNIRQTSSHLLPLILSTTS